MNELSKQKLDYPEWWWWQPALFAALAGGMGWGIRGQFGHETGAMIAGLLVSLTLVYMMCPPARLRFLVRAVALGTVAMGFGGSMTYGQTLGLSHDPDLVGNVYSLSWGLLGCAIKGSLWIGFAGAFLGLGLGGKRYGITELIFMMLCIIACFAGGIWLLNTPFDPGNRELPWIYFSDSWYWEPDKVLKPRPELWGGLLAGIIFLLAYTGFIKNDKLAFRLGLWGMLGGALGFPAGQAIQASNAWAPEFWRNILQPDVYPLINWWTMMETTFGAIMGFVLGMGLWRNQHLIQPDTEEAPATPTLALPVEILFLLIHIPMLVLVEFYAFPWVDMFYDHGVILGAIPIVAVASGRWWPYLLIYPITLIPIAGKTVRQVLFSENTTIEYSSGIGWYVFLILPLLLWILAAYSEGMRERNRQPTPFSVLASALVLNAWMYFMLNFAFFEYPLPWLEWTRRTPNFLIFCVCVLGLTFIAITGRLNTRKYF